MAIYNVEGREREYDDYVDPYQPTPQNINLPLTPMPNVPAGNLPTPAPTTTAGPRPYGPGVYTDPKTQPPFAAPAGTTWKYDPANGWYPGSNEIQWTGGTDTTGGTTTGGASGAFDYGRAPGPLPFSPYASMEPFKFSQGPLGFEPFSYESFRPSSWEDAEKEPGFQESQSRLAKMIQNTAAYRGILRSGATVGDLGTYLDQNKGQNFQQFDARRFRDYGANRDNAFGAWSANTGAKADTWSRNLGNEQFAYGQAATENDRGNNFRFNTEKAAFDDIMSRWTTLVNATTQLARPV